MGKSKMRKALWENPSSDWGHYTRNVMIMIILVGVHIYTDIKSYDSSNHQETTTVPRWRTV